MRVVVAVAHGLTRIGVRLALEQEQSGTPAFTIVGETDTGPKVLPLVGRTSPDVVLLDTDLPELDGLACLARLRDRFPEVVVLMIASDARQADLSLAFERGARGWILKTIAPQDLGQAIVESLEFAVFGPYGPVHDQHAAARVAGLSARESDIIRLISSGYSNKEIADELGVAIQTVKFHLTNLYRKIGVANRTSAVRWAQEAGLSLHGDTFGTPPRRVTESGGVDVPA